MSTTSNINKENFRLLDLSSDEESEDLQLEIIPSRKKKITRRERSRSIVAHRAPEPKVGREVQCALKWAVRGTLFLWLLMLTWICAALYDQVSTMRLEFARVITSSEGVGGALQMCDTAAKELRANASQLGERLAQLEHDHHELVKRVEQAAGQLASVSGQLSAAPKLADTPRRLAELQRTVADFGSQINGFDSALSSARKQALMAATGVEEVKTLVHQLEARSNETVANVTEGAKREDVLRGDIVALNTTLLARVDALQSKIQDFTKTTTPIAPTSSTPVTSSSTLPSQNSTTSTTTSTVPPAKPTLLQ